MTTEFKDAQPFPATGTLTVVGGVDASGNVQSLLLGTDGSLTASINTTGLATSALQTSGNASLTTLATTGAKQVTDPATFPTRVSVLYTSLVSGSYTQVLTNSAQIRYIKIVSAMPGGIFVSFDGTNDHFVIVAGATLEIPFGQYGLHHATHVWVKQTGAASGSVDIVAIAK